MFKTIRARLTLWYVTVFGGLLIAFSLYAYSLLSSTLRAQFDSSLLRAAQATATYFHEIAEERDVKASAEDTARELVLTGAAVAIYNGHQCLGSSDTKVTSLAIESGLLDSVDKSHGPAFATVGDSRLVALSEPDGTKEYVVILAQPLILLNQQLRNVFAILILSILTALCLAAISGYLLARRSLAPVVALSKQAEQISARNLDLRLETPHPDDELGLLANVLNGLLSRLDESFQIMRRFIADASHELRTPLSIGRAEIDVALSRERSLDEYAGSLQTVDKQLKRIVNIVNDMLALARADSGERYLTIEELYLDDVVNECCSSVDRLASLKGVNLDCEISEDLPFHGDEELLKRLVLNLLHNAVTYTPTGGSIRVMLSQEGENACLTVSDTGIGIPPENVGRVFDRFYRVNKARSRSDGGSGLGLSIAKLAVEAHEGTVNLESGLGRGTKFTVLLPLFHKSNGRGEQNNIYHASPQQHG